MKWRLKSLRPQVKKDLPVDVIIYMNNLEWKLRYLTQLLKGNEKE